MNTFRDFQENKEINEELGLRGAIAGVLIQVAIVAVIAEIIGLRSIIKSTKDSFTSARSQIQDAKIDIEFNKAELNNAVKEVSSEANTKEVESDITKTKKKYADELADLLKKIREKDFEGGKEEFDNISKVIRYDPKTHLLIIDEISKVLNQAPLYINSPGNECYRAIKTIVGIKEARAVAYSVKNTYKKIGDEIENGKQDS